jgi:Uncharacterised nucleotidyltransferase
MNSGPRPRSDLLALLRTIANGDDFPPLSSFNHKQIRWIIKTGLAPLVCFATGNDSNRAAWPLRSELKAADLSTRLLNYIQLETVIDLLTRCRDLLPPITLLKGCSISNDLYPQPHLRVMRDIDLLVEPKAGAILEAVLLEMGFRQQSTNSPEYYAAHHHSMPFYHPGKGVWVEVHRALFAPANLAELPVFSRQNITTESRLSSLNQIPVMRLSTEVQIVYTACHWALNLIDMKREGGLFGLLDLILLLRKSEKLRWDIIFGWVQDSVAGTHLYLALSYLSQNRIIYLDRDILAELFIRQRSFGTLNLRIAQRLITRYVVEGVTPIAQGKVAILWKNLLLDHGPARNIVSFCREIFIMKQSLSRAGSFCPIPLARRLWRNDFRKHS